MSVLYDQNRRMSIKTRGNRGAFHRAFNGYTEAK
jgi:hypothetical protein